jgi:cytochrome oxidase assembly protein ShyY1
MAWAIFVLVAWLGAWQLMRARDRKLDATHRLAARRRVRRVANRQRPETDDSQQVK